ncbi:uncharacterized protein LOC113324025 [Papaver somniferum]|uniref:uncharacterized protein LOC113324025 n=1 Tax=Papaver somniferum TaxID=3469 RepID=UPI000E6FB32D|nr:uncharacterized protein LOC113324025 [Papaver somniferum]
MATLVDSTLSREKLDTANARIKKMTKELNEEKSYSIKHDRKNEELQQSVVIRPDEDISEPGLGKDSDNSYPEPYLQLEAANIEVSMLDHLYSDIQQTLKSTILQMEDSEEHFKNQILHVSRERDDLRNEVSRFKADVEGLNTDLDEMDKDVAKVAKMSRKNTQDYLVKRFDEFCDGHSIPRVFLYLEFLSDDEKQDDERTLTDGEDGSDEDDKEKKAEDEGPKGMLVRVRQKLTKLTKIFPR